MRRNRVLVALVVGVLIVLGAPLAANAEQPPGPVTGTLKPGTTQRLVFTSSRQHVVLKINDTSNYERLFLRTVYDQVNLQYTAYGPDYTDYGIIARNPAYRSAITLTYLGWSYVDFYPAKYATGVVDITSYRSPRRAGGEIESGQTVKAATKQRGQQEAFTFFGKEGQTPTVSATAETFTDRDPPAPGRPDAVTVLFLGPGPDGYEQQPVGADAGIGPIDGHHSAYTEGRTLDITGTWTMIVQGRGPDSLGSMSFVFGLAEDQATTPMTAGTPTTVSTAQAGVNAARSIHLTAGQGLALTLSAASLSVPASPVGQVTPQVAVTVYGPDGSNGQTTDVGNGTGPTTVDYEATTDGTYAVVFDPLADTTGSLTATPGVSDGTGATR